MDERIEFGEVRYFFQVSIAAQQHTLAMMSVYSEPDADLLVRSSATVWSCRPGGMDGLRVIDVKLIRAVVAMVPHPRLPGHEAFQDRCFLVEKLGLLPARGVLPEDDGDDELEGEDD